MDLSILSLLPNLDALLLLVLARSVNCTPFLITVSWLFCLNATLSWFYLEKLNIIA
jgi:hypothetical protein